MVIHRLRRKHSVIVALLILAVAGIYWQVLGHEFTNYDDDDYVTENPLVQAGLTAASVKWAFTTSHACNWHPLTWLSHMLDAELFGMNPTGHHLTSLLLHLANTILLFLLFAGMTGSVWKSGFVAALFGIHPLHVESVAWVAERKDVLSTLFWILTMWAYVRYAESPNVKRYLPVLILFALGLTAKPMLVTLPFVLLLLDYRPLGRLIQEKSKSRKRGWAGWKLVWEKAPLFALAAASSAVTYIVQQRGGAMSSSERIALGDRAANALVSYATYLIKMLWPSKLAAIYPHPRGALPAWEVIGAAVALILISAAVFRARRPRPYLAVGWLWYVGTLVPVIGLVQVGWQARADRYTYVPLIGIFIMLAWVVGERETGGRSETGKRRKGETATPILPHAHTPILSAAAILAIVAIVALMTCSWFQIGYWKNSIALFEHAVKVTRNNDVAHNNLGWALGEVGRLDEAIEQYNEALRIFPDYVDAKGNLANALAKRGSSGEAERLYSEMLRLNPRDEKAHFNLGQMLAKEGRTDEAIAEFRQAIETKPEFAEAHYESGRQLRKQGKLDEAAAEYQETIRLKPDFSEAHDNLANIYFAQRKIAQAIAEYYEAIRVKPDNAKAHRNLAVALYYKGDYTGAWREVRATRALGLNPHPMLLKELSQKMAEP